jgi:hypothetical protein
MNILHLTLKNKWFDMILSGEKKEEYREIKDYWISRLAITFVHRHDEDGERFIFEPKDFDTVRFKNGYAKDSVFTDREVKGVRIGTGKPEWGAENNKNYFIIEFEDFKP